MRSSEPDQDLMSAARGSEELMVELLAAAAGSLPTYGRFSLMVCVWRYELAFWLLRALGWES